MSQIGIVLHGLLHTDSEGREHEAALHALGVHDRQAGLRLAVGRADRVERSERGANVFRRRFPTEVVVEAAGPGDGVEQRVRDESVDPAVHHEPRLALDRHPLHAATGEGRFDVAGEGVRRLVVVVVGVEEFESQIAHGVTCPRGDRPR